MPEQFGESRENCLSVHRCGRRKCSASAVAEEEATKHPTKSGPTADRCYVRRKEERQILKNLSKYEIVDEKRGMIAAVAEEKSSKSSNEEIPPPEEDKVSRVVIVDGETIWRPPLRMEEPLGIRRCGWRKDFVSAVADGETTSRPTGKVSDVKKES